MAFKMKGSPMYRNFGISPLKQGRIYVSDKNKEGSYVSEDEFESKFTQTGKDPANYPQLSVQDYSKVKVDKDGKKYVIKLPD
jgi:hypothetical protein